MDKETILQQLVQFKKSNASKFGIVKLGIFGSVARDTNAVGSDLDIVVELNKHNLFNSIGLKNSLSDYFGIPVDLISLGDHLRPIIKSRIEKEAIYV